MRNTTTLLNSISRLYQSLHQRRCRGSTSSASASSSMSALSAFSASIDRDKRMNFLPRLFSWYWPTSERMTLESEKRLLSLVAAPLQRRLVDIGGGIKINSIEVGKNIEEYTSSSNNLNNINNHNNIVKKKNIKNLVLTPGYACGLGHYYRNLEELAEQDNLKTFALDWLGTGRSSRPTFHPKPGQPGSVQNAEDFFVNSLENWRQKMQLDKMILVGHSFGGYLSSVYAMKYPERVEHLVLASPAGIGKRAVVDEGRRKKSFLYSTVNFLWNQKFGPQSIIRGSGRLGPKLVSAYTNARFSYLTSLEKDLLRDYSYHINASRGSGEFALNVIFTLGVQSRHPIVERARDIRVPTTFIYGSHDWMRVEDGREASNKINAPSKILVLNNAGHHLFLDNPRGFNSIILDLVSSLN